MENASKALIIAASTIIALLIIGSMVYLFRAGSAVGESYNRRQIQNNRELYNSKFLSYNRDNNNISDIVSLFNLAYDSNYSSEYSSSYAVIIDVKITNGCHFVMPNVEVEDFNRKNILLVKKNQIPSNLSELDSDMKIINTYSLMDTNILDIPYIGGITQCDENIDRLDNLNGLQVFNNDKFAETIRSAGARYNDTAYNVMSSLSPDTDNLVDDIIIYKFLFKCDGIEYNSQGRVSKMTFSCFNNYYEKHDGSSVIPNKNNGARGLNFIY